MDSDKIQEMKGVFKECLDSFTEGRARNEAKPFVEKAEQLFDSILDEVKQKFGVPESPKNR